MHRHWRDSKAWRDCGMPLTTTSNEACKLFDASVTQYVGWYEDGTVGGLEMSMDKTLEADPNFVMGHVIKNGLKLLGTATCTRKDSSLGKAIWDMAIISESQKNLTFAERRHVNAIKLWSEGQMNGAVAEWEMILLDNPCDILALKYAHDTYFYLGQSIQMRDSLARTMPKWKPETPLYGYLYGMYSFGLEENHEYAEAERVARRGLDINPKDAWSTHTMAHVIEMGGRQDEGIGFMAGTERDWSTCGMLACHNYWHWALHYIEKGLYDSALGIYDAYVGKMANKSGMSWDCVDAVSLLKRVELEGGKVGGRWKELFETVRPHIDDHVLSWNDNHIMLACLGANEKQVANQLMDSIKEWLQQARGDQVDIAKEVGLPICEAFMAYNDGNFSKAVDLLYPIKYKVVKIGGSNAQRDLYNLFLINSALKSNKSAHHKIARAMIAERRSAKGTSPLTDRLMQKAIAQHID